MRRLYYWLSAIIICLSWSCASIQQEDTQNITKHSIEIDNGNWAQANVYVVLSETSRIRLGEVSPLGKRTIHSTKIPRHMSFRVAVHLIGSRHSVDWLSESMSLTDGQNLILSIGHPIQYSYVMRQ